MLYAPLEATVHCTNCAMRILARNGDCKTPLGFLQVRKQEFNNVWFGTWSMDEAAKRIGNGEVCMMDAIEISTMGETIASINTICFGLRGRSAQLPKILQMGPARYNAVAVGKIMLGHKEKVLVSLEDAEGNVFQLEDTYLACFVNQTQHFGKGLRCAPGAIVDDGLMDFFAIKAGSVTRGDQLAMLQQMPPARIINHPGIYSKKYKSCTITFQLALGYL